MKKNADKNHFLNCVQYTPAYPAYRSLSPLLTTGTVGCARLPTCLCSTTPYALALRSADSVRVRRHAWSGCRVGDMSPVVLLLVRVRSDDVQYAP
jgi:hypothetical protein